MTRAPAAEPRQHRLSNGVTLICDPVAGFETLALSVVAGRGARWEDPARSGGRPVRSSRRSRPTAAR